MLISTALEEAQYPGKVKLGVDGDWRHSGLFFVLISITASFSKIGFGLFI
jgi:hypothetical protein